MNKKLICSIIFHKNLMDSQMHNSFVEELFEQNSNILIYDAFNMDEKVSDIDITELLEEKSSKLNKAYTVIQVPLFLDDEKVVTYPEVESFLNKNKKHIGSKLIVVGTVDIQDTSNELETLINSYLIDKLDCNNYFFVDRKANFYSIFKGKKVNASNLFSYLQCVNA